MRAVATPRQPGRCAYTVGNPVKLTAKASFSEWEWDIAKRRGTAEAENRCGNIRLNEVHAAPWCTPGRVLLRRPRG